MELCKTVRTNKTSLNSIEQRNMVDATTRPTQERQNNIIELFNKSHVGTDPILKVIEISLSGFCPIFKKMIQFFKRNSELIMFQIE